MTTVVDASAVVELLLGVVPASRRHEFSEELIAPDFIHAEVASAVRRIRLRDEIDEAKAQLLVHDLLELPIDIVPSRELISRAFDFCQRLGVYDACYVALAESLNAPLLTADRRLARASGLPVTVRVL